jgi:sarcosine oxidase subunit gamma
VTASTERAAPLAAWGQRLAAASGTPAAFAIREIPFVSQVNIRGTAADPAFAGALRTLLGCDLPVSPNTWTSGTDCGALWLGPDEWLVVAPEGRNESLVSGLRSSLEGVHASVTDVSANRTILEVSGEHARLVLAKGCPLDLHSSALSAPQCAQTLLAKSQMILQCTDSRPTFRIFVRISFAPYVAEWLIDAALECATARRLDSDRIASRMA